MYDIGMCDIFIIYRFSPDLSYSMVQPTYNIELLHYLCFVIINVFLITLLIVSMFQIPMMQINDEIQYWNFVCLAINYFCKLIFTVRFISMCRTIIYSNNWSQCIA